MLTRRTLLAATAALLSLAPAFAQDHPETLHIHDAYARVNGGIGATGAAFFTVHNNGTADDRIIGARADIADKVELHTHIMDEAGVMKMVEVKEGFPVPAGDMHMLERGADHVMLMGLKAELKDGDTFPLTVVFDSGAEVTVEVPIDNARMPAEGDMQMDHSSHGTNG